MALLPVDDLCGPSYNASLRPRRLLGQSRPLRFRVDGLALRHCVSGRDDPGRHEYSRRVI
jgi:hypothetical protein